MVRPFKPTFLCVSLPLGGATIYIVVSMDFIKTQPSVLNLFMSSANIFAPCLQVSSAFPVLYYLVTCYPPIVQDNLLPSPEKAWFFLLEILLCIVAFSADLVLTLPGFTNGGKIGLVIFCVLFYATTLVHSFMILVCITETRLRLETSKPFGESKYKLALEIHDQFQALKVGISPLLFLSFSMKCILLISCLTLLLTQHIWGLLPLIIYTMYDLVYTTIILDQTFLSLKGVALDLR